MQSERSKRVLTLLIVIIAAIAVFVIIAVYKWKSRPEGSEILSYIEKVYKRDFQIVEEYTYIAHTDGEAQTQRELKCPAVILQDKENQDICFIAYAYPLEGGGWIYRDNYFQKVLIDCIRQEQLEMNNEDLCGARESFLPPCLVLENTDETAEKLQNMVIRFNELCQYDDSDGYVDHNEAFGVEGSGLQYQVLCGNINDRWLDETSPFCYDTPIEKYKAFLDKLEEE